jgi:HEAT repeat protein
MPVFDAFESDVDDIALNCASADAGVRRVAMMQLADVVDGGAIPLLIKGLGDADASVREAAAKAIDEHDGDGVVAALVKALEDSVPAVRAAAAETLAEKKDPASAALLIAAAEHPVPRVIPTMVPRTFEFHHGEPSPTKAGTR